MSARRILIAGIGNILLGDDGFGVEVVRRLKEQALPAEVEVRDFGIRGFDFAYALLEPYDAVIVADAAEFGAAPGSLRVMELCFAERPVSADNASSGPHAAIRALSPLNGERAGVRGGMAKGFANIEASRQDHPSSPTLLPVEGRREEQAQRLSGSRAQGANHDSEDSLPVEGRGKREGHALENHEADCESSAQRGDDTAPYATLELPQTHGMIPTRAIEFARQLGGTIPPLRFVLCQPQSFGDESDGRLGLSEPVSAAVSEAVELIASLIERLRSSREPCTNSA